MDDAMKAPAAEVVRRLKEQVIPIPVFQYGRKWGWLESVTWGDLERAETLAEVTAWRRQASAALAGTFPLTAGGTRQWLVGDVLEAPDVILFWVRGLDGARVGHAGLSGIDARNGAAEIAHLLRGVTQSHPGIMYCGAQSLMAWAYQTLEVEQINARVARGNTRMLRLLHRCGFATLPGGPDAAVVMLCMSRAEWMSPNLYDRAA
jgi:RimJ/RimL family protein N-acetyltransferase